MSAALTAAAETLAERIRSTGLVATLAVPVHVFGDEDFGAKIEGELLKARGLVVAVAFEDFPVLKGTTASPAGFTASVWSKRALRQGKTPALEIFTDMLLHVHEWAPAGEHCHGEYAAVSGGLVPNAKYTIYEARLTRDVYLGAKGAA